MGGCCAGLSGESGSLESGYSWSQSVCTEIN